MAVVEERAGDFAVPPGFEEIDRRQAGETEVTFSRFRR
jgi:hypothetical protein